MEPAGSASELDGRAFRVVGMACRAVPQARAAVDALVSIKGWDALVARRDGLSGAHLYADLRAAGLAQVGIQKHHVVCIAGRRLDLAAHQERVLVADQ